MPIRRVLALIPLLLPFSAAAARLDVEARPSAVTIFPDQARVTRSVAVDVPQGESLIVISGVSGSILADSLTARGHATAPVSIGSVDLRPVSVDASPDAPRIAALRDQIQEVEGQIAVIDVQIAGNNADKALIERLANAAPVSILPAGGDQGQAGLANNPEAWAAARMAVRSGIVESMGGILEGRNLKRPLEDRLARLNGELAAATGGRTRASAGQREIAVGIQAERATRFTLEVTYQVAGAAWKPVYEARLDTGSGNVRLLQEAMVRQATGEDWHGVSVILSTARPSATVRAPELNSAWRIGLADNSPPPSAGRSMGQLPSVPSVQAAAPVSPAFLERLVEADRVRQESSRQGAASALPAPMLQNGMGMLPPAPVADASYMAAAVTMSGLSVQYEVAGPIDLNADGTERKLRIAESEIPVKLGVRTVPRVDPRAFLEAAFQGPPGAPLLGGSVSLNLDGTFIGRTTMPLLRPGQDVRLPFGVDDRVSVVYEPQEIRQDTSGWAVTGRRASRRAEGLAILRSTHARPIEVTVVDQVPVSADGDLTVAPQFDPQPTARDVDNRPGVVAWGFTLSPSEERRIRSGWTVTAPEGRGITGLEQPRR